MTRSLRCRTFAFLVVAAIGTTAVPARAAAPAWVARIDHLVSGRRMSVAVGIDGGFLYRHRAATARIPASNEKLMLSMALFDRLGPATTIATSVEATAAPVDGVVHGDLWILGHGDPEIGRKQIAALADEVVAAGITRVRGHVYGSTSFFARDWWAPGWRSYFPAVEIAIPTALTFEGNVGPSGGHISDPELRAADALATQLELRGVPVGRTGMGRPPRGLVPTASITSDPLKAIVGRMDVDSINFDAEVLGKLLGRTEEGPPGTIAKCAAALEAFVGDQGTRIAASDCSGLSYDDRVSPSAMLHLLWAADASPWLVPLRLALPRAGQGTLKDRLSGIRVRAKTGTLTDVSALSGWVWLSSRGSWAEFSILSQGMSKATAVKIEDAIVRTVATHAG